MLPQLPRSLLGALLLALTTLAPAQASPVNYHEGFTSEGIFDELPSQPTRLFLLDVGVNFIGGTNARSWPPIPTWLSDYDSFAFEVPSGTHVTSIQYDYAFGFVRGSGGTGYDLYSGSIFNYPATEIVDPGLPPYPDFNGFITGTRQFFKDLMPLGPGTYYLKNEWAWGGEAWANAYEFRLTLLRDGGGSVPEPGTLPLLGLAALAGWAKRRRRYIH